MAQLVEYHLAKVRVAGSSPVVRSVARPTPDSSGPNLVGWPRGEAGACKAVYTGSNPVPTSRAIGAAVARFPDTEEVTGSIPVSPTKQGNLLHAVRTARPERTSYADVAQLVEHHLAKVDVASSNLVVRSQDTVAARFPGTDAYTVGWPRGEAAACKAVYTGSNPVATSKHHPI